MKVQKEKLFFDEKLSTLLLKKMNILQFKWDKWEKFEKDFFLSVLFVYFDFSKIITFYTKKK